MEKFGYYFIGVLAVLFIVGSLLQSVGIAWVIGGIVGAAALGGLIWWVIVIFRE